MRITAVNNFNKGQRFGSNSDNVDNIEKQTKQILRDHFEEMQSQADAEFSKKYRDQYFPLFMELIESGKKEVNQNDVKNVFKSLQDAYKEAGMNDDANVLGSYLSKIG